MERLAGLERATVDDMVAIHRDVVSLRAPVWIARLDRALPRSDEFEIRALDLLTAWDHEVQADSGAAAVFMVVRDSVCRQLAHHPAFGAVATAVRRRAEQHLRAAPRRACGRRPPRSSRRDDHTLLAHGESWTDVLAGTCLADAVAILRTTARRRPGCVAVGRAPSRTRRSTRSPRCTRSGPDNWIRIRSNCRVSGTPSSRRRTRWVRLRGHRRLGRPLRLRPGGLGRQRLDRAARRARRRGEPALRRPAGCMGEG